VEINLRWDANGSGRDERDRDTKRSLPANSNDEAIEIRPKEPNSGPRDANGITFSAPARGAVETELATSNARRLQPLMGKNSDRDAEAALRLAGTEAAALAWTTPFPLLFLPALLEEKVARTERYLARQKAMFLRDTCRAMAMAA